MRGFVLAAGFGTRMRPLTDHIPKAMVPVCGRTLLERALRFIHRSGIKEIGVNAHYLHEQLEAFREQSVIPFELFVESGRIRGTGGAFDFARPFLNDDDAFFVLNVDILCKFDLMKAIEKFKQSNCICMLIAFPCEKGKGTILFDKESYAYYGTPSEIEKKTFMEEAAFIGAAIYRKEFLGYVGTEDFSVVPIWKRLAVNGLPVIVNVQLDGFWRDIGNIDALANIHFECLDKKIDIDVPEDLRVNTKEKFCIPDNLNKNQCFSGKYAWIESNKILNCTINRSIIWSGMQISNKEITNSIVTPFGELTIS